MANNDNNQGAFAAAAILAQQNNRALENVRSQYANEKFHDFNIVKEDALQRRAEFRAQKEHDAQLALEESITTLAREAADLKKSGNLEASKAKQIEINNLRRQGVGDDAFDTDEVTRNFASTLDEVIEDFGQATRDEMKVSIQRMSALMDSIEVSNAHEKDFLLEQYKQTQEAMQKEYNKRANVAARAMEKASELSEQYLDISSLYAGFVDHNPVMMTLFRLGSDFIKRNRISKKAQRDALLRDKKNQAFAEKQNAENALRADIEKARDDQINAQREATMAIEREAAKKNKKNADDTQEQIEQAPADIAPEIEPAQEQAIERVVESAPADTAPEVEPVQEQVIERVVEESAPAAFDFPQDEFSGTGDEPLTQDFMASLFGDVDEDGDPTGFERVDNNDSPIELDDSTPVRVEQVDSPTQGAPVDVQPGMIKVDDSTPIMVQQSEPSAEDKAQALFVRQDAEQRQRLDTEFQAEQIVRDEKMFTKLEDIEDAILAGNKITKENGKALDKIDGGGGLLEMLGLGKVGQLLKGPVLKALMMFSPIVAGLGALLSKLGLGGLAGKLTGGFDRVTGRQPGTTGSRPGARTAGRPGLFSRVASGGKNLLSRGGSLLARGGGLAMRGGAALLGTTAGALTASGAAGYGVGTLINDHVLSDEQKEGISDVIGPAIDNVLSFFGSDDAKRRLELHEQMKNGTLFNNPKPAAAPNASVPEELEAANDSDVFTKEDNGNKLVIQTDSINSNKVVNTKTANSQIEVPVQKKHQEKLEMLEEKVTALADAEAKASSTAVTLPAQKPKPTTQKVVKSEAQSNMLQRDRSARNPDSSIQRITDRFVSMGSA